MITVSYGHAVKLAAIAAAGAPVGSTKPAPLIDPALYRRDDVRPVLAERDIAALYLILKDEGVTQRQIAELTGQSQSEVSEILGGRKVLSYDLLVRIAQGLGIPRGLMGLSYGDSTAYGGEGTVTSPEEVAEMLRRHLIELGVGVAVGAPVAKLGELLEHLAELPGPSPVPLPSQLSGVHVVKVRDLTRRLDEATINAGSDPEVSSAAAGWASRLLDVPGPDAVRKALMTAVAELHIQAGWAGFDAGLYDRAMFHYARALDLAIEAGDAYCQVLALNYAGLATVEHGRPNDGLKMLQCGGVTALDVSPDRDPSAVVIGERSQVALKACAGADSATALSCLDEPEKANTALAEARELWQPTRTDPGGDLDLVAARLELDRGRLDAAEQFAAASVRRWESGSRVSRTQSTIVLATVHVRAGEPGGLQLAHSAVTAAAKLGSVRARRRLEPLAAALETRPGSDARQLARMARQVAATRV